MKRFRIVFILLCLNIVLTTSCADYLDIIPDDLATVDDAFSSRSNADKFRATCYGYLPSVVRPFHDPVWIASRGDDFWFYAHSDAYPDLGAGSTPMGLAIMQGGQNTNDPYLNYWDGGNGGIPLFRGIRECNIFLENVEENNTVPDVNEEERTWWIGEIRFVKAYLHFYLMKLYGPIPIIKRNPGMDASPEEIRVFREPIDEVVDYIVSELDEAAKFLEEAKSDEKVMRGNPDEWGGRITKSIALAVKAKVLVWAASPLLNGNSFYSEFKDSRGKQLIPSDFKIEKWQKAAEACDEALKWIESTGYYGLYTQYNSDGRSDASELTKRKFILRDAITEPFNKEIIWPSTHPTNEFGGWQTGRQNLWQMNMERECMPGFHSVGSGNFGLHNGSQGTTMKMAEQFYTKNGLPIKDDSEWQGLIGTYESRYHTRLATVDGIHDYYIKSGARTAQLNFFREPRFYAYVGFDGGIWEGAGKSQDEYYVVDKKKLTYNQVPTGYYIKKVVHPRSNFSSLGTTYSYTPTAYSFPYIRLSDLYLLYAESLIESLPGEDDIAVPGDVLSKALNYVNEVRKRADVPKVEESWELPTCLRKGLYKTKRGMREIIRKERAVELCFEGKRSEDMRRWRIAHIEYNEPIRGWNGITPYSNITDPGALTDDIYYQVTEHYTLRGGYGVKDYLWPIKADNLNVNNNLVQNLGW
jgi:hypothetical protein